MGTLDSALRDWLAASPAPPKIRAALKDCLALLEIAPDNPNNIDKIQSGTVPRLRALAILTRQLRDSLTHTILPAIRRCSRGGDISGSPYAGGSLVEHADLKASVGASRRQRCIRKAVHIASLNPGRTGFLSIYAEEILWWRLWSIASALEERSVDICVLPGEMAASFIH